MATPAVSVIVPIYKVEKFLPKCVESLLNQTFSDLEILLVDDGSPDGCPALCDEYAARDARIRVIHKENGGISSARNAGIDAARGRYIGFVDGDDYTEPEMYEVLYDLAEKNQADMSVCGFYRCFADTRKPETRIVPPFVCSGEEALERVWRRKDIRVYVWSRLYRRELFETTRFPEGHSWEDIYVTAELHLSAARVAVDNRPLYNYIQRAGSITNTAFTPAAMDVVDSYQHAHAVTSARAPGLAFLTESLLRYAYFTVFDKMMVMKDYRKLPSYAPVRRYLLRNAWKLLGERVTMLRRLAILAFYIHPALYRKLVFLRNQKKHDLIR